MKPVKEAAAQRKAAGTAHQTVNHKDWYNERHLAETKATIRGFLSGIQNNPEAMGRINDAMMTAYYGDEDEAPAVIAALKQEVDR